MIPKFTNLQTKGQILSLFRQYPSLTLEVPKRGQAVSYASRHGKSLAGIVLDCKTGIYTFELV